MTTLRVSIGNKAGYDSLVVWTKPVEDLVEPGAVLPSGGALPNQGGVGGKDHSLPHTTIPLTTDLPIVELQVQAEM